MRGSGRIGMMAVAVLGGVLVTSAHALVIQNATNTTDGTGVYGFSNVGSVNGASAVYLGSGWVLTATHIAGLNITLSTGSYTGDASYAVPNSDLTLVHLNATINLPQLVIASSVPTTNEVVTMIGNGFSTGSKVYYSVNTTDPNNYVWTSRTTLVGANAAGYAYAAQMKQFGTSTVGTDPETGNLLYTSNGSTGFFVNFYTGSLGGQTSLLEQSIATDGDSGGGVFANNSLLGIIDEKYTYDNQPTQTAIYGLGSFIINLSSYTSSIQTITGIDFTVSPVPEPASLGLLAVGPLLLMRRRAKR